MSTHSITYERQISDDQDEKMEIECQDNEIYLRDGYSGRFSMSYSEFQRCIEAVAAYEKMKEATKQMEAA